ncbi:MAG: SixA phosphatase family protein [Alphaproteobacteria bacterium]
MDSYLILLRHAETQIGLRDHDRKLTKKGKSEGKKVAELLVNKYQNLRAISSNSKRTIQTSKFITDLLPGLKIDYLKELYLASSIEMADIILEYSTSKKNILCIGHNPGIHQLALSLVNINQINESSKIIKNKFPSSSLAIIKIKDSDWGNIYTNQNTLIDFITPKLV